MYSFYSLSLRNLFGVNTFSKYLLSKTLNNIILQSYQRKFIINLYKAALHLLTLNSYPLKDNLEATEFLEKMPDQLVSQENRVNI